MDNYQEGRCLGLDSSNEPQSVISQNLITRKAGGRREAEREMQVRMSKFRSVDNYIIGRRHPNTETFFLTRSLWT